MKRKRRAFPPNENTTARKENILRKYPWLRYPLYTLIGAVSLTIILIVALSQNLPSLHELEQAGDPYLVSRILSADGKVLDELFLQKRLKVPLEQMPDHLINATLASEDRRFYNHWGLDLKRIFYLGFRNITTMHIHGGASTITAQLAKKLYFNPRKTIIRKIREGLTAVQIERTYSKNEILEMYLNQMPLGRGVHGVQSAALAYFGKDVEDLQIQESAMLVGLFQLPYGYYSPDRDTVAAVNRRNVILQSMLVCGYITEAEYDSVSVLPLGVIERGSKDKSIAPYFCEYVRRLMQDKYHMRLYTDGLTIETSLDTRIQACADSAIKQFLPDLEKKIHKRIIEKREFLPWLNPEPETEEEIKAVLADSVFMDSLLTARATLQTALVALNPTNGQILAMVGGRGLDTKGFNRAVQAKRQPGSAFKPIAYTAAIHNGYPPTTELMNVPIVLEMVDGTTWRPKNYDESWGKLVTFREALKRSINVATVYLIQQIIPPQTVVRWARNFGITTTIHPYDGVALGQDPVIPIELTSAFGVFANKGVLVEPNAIVRVLDKEGNVLEENVPKKQEVVDEETAYVMTDLLRSVLDDEGGTARSARWRYNFYRPAAGKTGTTNDFRNAWFVGFTPQITAGVWVGFDDERITLGEGQSGGVTALPIWAPFMRMVYDTLGNELPLQDFKKPDGVDRIKICLDSKKIATDTCPRTAEEVFIHDKNEPTEFCPLHKGSGAYPTQKRKRKIF